MEKFKRNFCTLAVVMTLIISSTPAFAISETCIHGNRTFNDRRLTGGVGQYGKFRRYYWLSSNVSSDYVSTIAAAVSNWVNTTTNPGVTTSISIRQTTTQSSSSFDIYDFSFAGSTTGLTEFWIYSTYINDPSASNWGWTKIFIDCNKTSYYSIFDKTGLVAHELGHAMGLSHQPNLPGISIMYNYDDYRDRDRPGSIDCNNINHIYE
mgnify:CR=1 FL=1